MRPKKNISPLTLDCLSLVFIDKEVAISVLLEEGVVLDSEFVVATSTTLSTSSSRNNHVGP